MSGESRHPCLVPELTTKSFLEVVPLAFTLALILLLQYTVLRSALNLSTVKLGEDRVDGGKAY
jgi:hypothetical protein